MTSNGRLLIAMALVAGVAGAQGAQNQRRPYVGYLCAAGAQRGTVTKIVAGGQNLRGANRVFVSGHGVHGKVVGHRRAAWLVKPDERRVIAQHIRRLASRKLAAQGGDSREAKRRGKKPPAKKKQAKPGDGKKAGQKPVALPDHPMLKNLDSMTPRELRRVAYEFLDPARRSQLSAQIVETVEIELTIEPDAAPGERELRIGTRQGLTNPVLFQVGSFPESLEHEPNDYRTLNQPTADLPQVLNGQVSFKDIDRFRFRASRGQKLVIEAQARKLVPYLADAVPGWFQATLTLYDAKGRQLRFADDYRFDPDPVLFFEVPEDGEYVLEIRDAIYRGRQDFVYRITVAERPFITTMFPLGGPMGSATVADVEGWNLPWNQVALDTGFGVDSNRRSAWDSAGMQTNLVQYAAGEFAECNEIEPNDTPERAQRVDLPKIVNGRISSAGEVDLYRFEGRAGEAVVAEVQARRLGSPLDSLLQLTDAEGRVVAWNDDHHDKTAGLVTHQADSYVHARLPAAGTYYVRVADSQGQGDPACAYRLRLSGPQPDFDVIVTPASLSVIGGGAVPITVHAVRKDGFEGEIDLSVAEPAQGLFLSGGRIPAGCDRIRMTLTALPRRSGDPVPIRIVGRARFEGRTYTRSAIPAEDMMQAFGLRHLVPAQQLLVDVRKFWRTLPALRLERADRAKIPVGGTTEVRIAAPGRKGGVKVEFRLSEPPAGVTLRDARIEPGAIVLVLAAERGKAKAGLADNLIVEAYMEAGTGRGRARAKPAKKAKPDEKAKPADKAKAAKRTRRFFAGVLPAVPIVIVEET